MTQEQGKLVLDPIEIGDDAVQVLIFKEHGTETPIPQGNKTYEFSIALDPRNLANECADYYLVFTVPDDENSEQGIVRIPIPKETTIKFKQAVYHFKLRRIFTESLVEEDKIITFFDGTIPFEH